MLSELELERYITPILKRQREINQFVIETICKRINDIGKMNVSDVHRLESLYRMGADARLINAEIARLTGLNVQDIKSMIREIALVDYMDTKPFYDYRHKSFIPFKENKQLINYVNAMAEYLADRIANGYLDYKEVIKKYPRYKAEIDEILGIA